MSFTQIQLNIQLRNLEVTCLHLLSSFLQNIDQVIDFVCRKWISWSVLQSHDLWFCEPFTILTIISILTTLVFGPIILNWIVSIANSLLIYVLLYCKIHEIIVIIMPGVEFSLYIFLYWFTLNQFNQKTFFFSYGVPISIYTHTHTHKEMDR